MARKSGPRQLKRELAPGFWPINRKKVTWAPRTRPGPHPRAKSLPLIIVLREILGFAKTAREAIHVISTGKVKVDGIVRKDHRFPTGLMDVIQIEGITGIFRVMPKLNAGLTPTQIALNESGFKLCKIVGKRNVAGGRTQLNFHDGRNLIIQSGDPRPKTGEEYPVGSVIQLGLPQQKIIRQIPFQTGALGLVVDGRNQGRIGRIESITPGSHARQKIVRIETTAGSFETPAEYVVPVGTDTPLISLGKQ